MGEHTEPVSHSGFLKVEFGSPAEVLEGQGRRTVKT